MNADTVDDGIRPGKVDIFKNAHLFGRGPAVAGVGVDAVAVKGQDFSRQNVPLEFRADSVKGDVYKRQVQIQSTALWPLTAASSTTSSAV